MESIEYLVHLSVVRGVLEMWLKLWCGLVRSISNTKQRGERTVRNFGEKSKMFRKGKGKVIIVYHMAHLKVVLYNHNNADL